MATIKQFEDIEVWQQSMSLCTDIYKITNNDRFTKDYGLKDQIRRSAISVPSNIAEGFERNGKKQFTYFLTIAKASCGEIRTQLTIAHNLNYLELYDFNLILEKCINTSKQIAGLIKYLNRLQDSKIGRLED
jgi:four helix bundle protein